MIVSHQVSALWLDRSSRLTTEIAKIFERHPKATVFFRADDVAIPSAKQNRLLQLFAHHDTPLCAAIVPAWINRSRWQNIVEQIDGKQGLFAWHQHGWNHLNHEASGKKQEFGPGADLEQKRRNIARGQQKLTEILGDYFLPIFTPPWNRTDQETMQILKDLGFLAISRYRAAKIPTLTGLPDLAANVDLHTRKETTAELGCQALLAELDYALATGLAGLMIHHQRMNDQAFAFLDWLLTDLSKRPGIRLCHYAALLNFLPASLKNIS